MCNCFILLKIIKDEEVCRTSKESLAKTTRSTPRDPPLGLKKSPVTKARDRYPLTTA